MRRDLLTSLIAVVFMTVVFGLAYPLVFTGVAQVLFPGKADGSKITENGQVVGSSLIAQKFTTQRQARPALLPAASLADRLRPVGHLLQQPRAQQQVREAEGQAPTSPTT